MVISNSSAAAFTGPGTADTTPSASRGCTCTPITACAPSRAPSRTASAAPEGGASSRGCSSAAIGAVAQLDRGGQLVGDRRPELLHLNAAHLRAVHLHPFLPCRPVSGPKHPP